MTRLQTGTFPSIAEYLNPESSQHAPTPLVRLPEALNPFAELDVEIWAKLAFANPLFQSKWYAAHGLLSAASRKGLLGGVHTLVDNSSGNTALGLVALAALYGIEDVVMTVPLDIPGSKLEILRLFGCHAEPTTGGIEKSRALGEQDGWYCTSQYHNADNPDGFARTLGKQLWEQLEKSLTVLCASMGTSGTIVGCAAPFRANGFRNFTVVGAIPAIDQVPGTRSLGRLEEIGLDWRGAIDTYLERSPKDAYRTSLQLCRYGILGGPSSGLALTVLTDFLHAAREDGRLRELRNESGKVVAVFICPDTLLPYLDKYTTHLEPEDLE